MQPEATSHKPEAEGARRKSQKPAKIQKLEAKSQPKKNTPPFQIHSVVCQQWNRCACFNDRHETIPGMHKIQQLQYCLEENNIQQLCSHLRMLQHHTAPTQHSYTVPIPTK